MRKFCLLLLSYFLTLACQDLNSIKPPNELNLSERYGTFIDTTILATADTFIVDYRISTLYAPKLSLGRYKNFEASLLIKFTGLPSINELIDSVYIELSALNRLGEVSSDLNVAVFKVDKEWDEAANLSDEWHNDLPSQEIKKLPFPVEDSSKIRIAIEDTSLFNQWRREKDSNLGLYLRLADSGERYIREIASFEYMFSSNVKEFLPKLIYNIYDNEDSVFVKDTLQTGLDVTIIDYNPPAHENVFDIARTQGDLLIASGVAARIFLKFDGLSSIPPNSIIQKAEIFMPVKDEDFFTGLSPNTLENDNNYQQFYLRSVKEANDNLSYFKVDSVFSLYSNYVVSLRKAESYISAVDVEEQVKFGQSYLQDILNGTRSSEWFYLQYKNERQDISVLRLAGLREEPARLNIRYFKVKQHVF